MLFDWAYTAWGKKGSFGSFAGRWKGTVVQCFLYVGWRLARVQGSSCLAKVF